MDKDPPALEAWTMFWRHEKTFDLFVSHTLHGTPLHETVMDEYVAWAEARALYTSLGFRASCYFVLYCKKL